jgi:hypothetical protein
MAAIPAVSGVAADIVGYFRTNYSIAGQEVTLENDALAATVAGQIAKYKVHLLNFNMVGGSKIITRFAELIKRTQELKETTALLRIQVVDPATAEIETLTTQAAKQEAELNALSEEQADQATALETKINESQEQLARDKELLEAANAAIGASENLSKAAGDLITAVSTAPDDKTPPALVQAALRKHIREQGITHLLYLKILSSGGEAMTKQSIWRSGQTAYIGGSAIAYVLVTAAGEVISADTEVSVAQLDHTLGKPDAAKLATIPFTFE